MLFFFYVLKRKTNDLNNNYLTQIIETAKCRNGFMVAQHWTNANAASIHTVVLIYNDRVYCVWFCMYEPI